MSDQEFTGEGLYKRWPSKAIQNEQQWGEQRVETLLLAMTEELGELTQAHLEGQSTPSVRAELDDLAALCIQLNRRLNAGDR